MLKVCCVSARDGAAPVISQEPATSGPEAGNYVKTFPVDSPAMGIDETWQVDIDSIPSKRLGRPNIHGREPRHTVVVPAEKPQWNGAWSCHKLIRS